jgi:hypothetical protein
MRNFGLGLVFTAMFHGIGWAKNSQDLFGVWSGGIGKLPVVVCLNTKRDHHFGTYYYRAHVKAIHLSEKQNGTSWVEGNSEEEGAPQWQLESVGDGQISGTWTAKHKSLPISLERLAGNPKDVDGQESACGSDMFLKPRVTPPKIIETPAELDGQSFVKVSVDAGEQFDVSFETFKLKGPGANIANINKILLRDLPQPGKKPDYLECIQSGLANSGYDGIYDVGTGPVILTDHWLVVNSGDGSFCEGAHPVNSSSETVYDLRKGTVVNLEKWLKPGFVGELLK